MALRVGPTHPFSKQVEVRSSKWNFIYGIFKLKFGGTITESYNEALKK